MKHDALMRAVKEGSVPFGYYGPETCRWATPDEMRRFSLEDCPVVHLDKSGVLVAAVGRGVTILQVELLVGANSAPALANSDSRPISKHGAF